MNEKILVENGIVYKNDKTEVYEVKEFIDYENSLKFDVIINKISDTTVGVKGTIYKENYEGNIVEIKNPVTIKLSGYCNNTILSPNNGMVDLDIELPNDIESINVTETNVEKVFGTRRVNI
ncbi:hypothetical protein PV797_05485 [Clostridiaceae bacterium M8S5]|nr:hypothetical protein PV797_05485 [Clostridiaceae bacterium M8S5]